MYKSTKIFILFLISFATVTFSCKDNNTQKANHKQQDTVKYTGPAIIIFEETNFNFGTLTAGEKVECSFKFKNGGGKILKILNIQSDCGCTVPKLENKNLKPGETQKIKVTFDSEGFTGNIFKTITVKTNTKKKETELYISALIKNPNIINNN